MGDDYPEWALAIFAERIERYDEFIEKKGNAGAINPCKICETTKFVRRKTWDCEVCILGDGNGPDAFGTPPCFSENTPRLKVVEHVPPKYQVASLIRRRQWVIDKFSAHGVRITYE